MLFFTEAAPWLHISNKEYLILILRLPFVFPLSLFVVPSRKYGCSILPPKFLSCVKVEEVVRGIKKPMALPVLLKRLILFVFFEFSLCELKIKILFALADFNFLLKSKGFRQWIQKYFWFMVYSPRLILKMRVLVALSASQLTENFPVFSFFTFRLIIIVKGCQLELHQQWFYLENNSRSVFVSLIL